VANFFYCMLLHPEVQEKLHEELDRVVGQDRLPTFDDHVNLRYLEAVRKEGNRWQPLGPIGRILIVTLIYCALTQLLHRYTAQIQK
jgi:cytochrome P450